MQGSFDLAVPGALQASRFCADLYGKDSVKIVPCYIVLAEANLGLRRLKAAEEFLSLANW